MSEFVVSARKYRPQRFDEVVGQEHVSETLKNALRQNRLAHAFLFCGPRGVGKTTNARILAKVLNCLDVGADYEPCNACANCVAFNQNASFNIFELDGASNNKVDHMHQLTEQVRVPPQAGRKKVYIIDEVHMLSQAAFNAFLKTLEEPPDYAVFILATTEKHRILPTILSRCQVYDFHRIRPQATVAHLEGICAEEGLTAEPEALHLVAEKADGALRDALSIFDRLVSSAPGRELTYAHAAEQLNVLDHGTFFRVTDALLREDAAALYLLFDEVLAAGFEPEPFLQGLARHLRQLFVCKSPATLRLLEVSDALRRRYAEQAALAPMGFLANALNLAAECDFRMRQAAEKRLHVELYLVKMAYAQRTVRREAVATPAAPAAPPEKKSEAVGGTKDERRTTNDGPAVPVLPNPVRPAPGGTKDQGRTTNDEGTPPAPSAPPQPPQPPQPLSGRPDNPSTEPPNNPPPASAAIPSISFDDEDDAGADAGDFVAPDDLTLEQLQAAWTDAEADKPQRVKSIMRRAQLDYAAPQLTIRVGSALAQNTLRGENAMLVAIKERLRCPDLAIGVELDPALAPKEPPKKKVFGPKEQYQTLLEVNPEVDALRKRLGLKYEE